MRHKAKMEDVASGAHAAIVKRDWGALQPLLQPYLHRVQADGQGETIAERPSATGAHPPGGCFGQEPRGHERPRC
jgi:hypothetical protein